MVLPIRAWGWRPGPRHWGPHPGLETTSSSKSGSRLPPVFAEGPSAGRLAPLTKRERAEKAERPQVKAPLWSEACWAPPPLHRQPLSAGRRCPCLQGPSPLLRPQAWPVAVDRFFPLYPEFKKITGLTTLFSRSVMSDCNPRDCSPPGSSVHGILQARRQTSGLPFPPPGGLPDAGHKPASSVLQAGSFPLGQQGSPGTFCPWL